MKRLTFTVGSGGNFISCLLCHSKYNKPIHSVQHNEYKSQYDFRQGMISHYVTDDPTIVIHEPNKKYLYKKQTILLYKRMKDNKKLFVDGRLSVQSLIYDGNFEFQIDRQIKGVVDFRHVYTWNNLFYNINKDNWVELFDFFKCDFHDEYLTRIEDYSKRNDEIFNSDETKRIREFLQKYT